MKNLLRAGGTLLVLMFGYVLFSSTTNAATQYLLTPSTPTVRAGEAVTFVVSEKTDTTTTDVTVSAVLTTDDPSGTITTATYVGGKVGSWTVTASINGQTATTGVIVTPGTVARLRLEPHDDPVSVQTGATKQFSVTAYDAYNNVVADAAITWSGVFSIGSVSANGLLTATKPGSSQIIAQSGTAIDTVTVKVTAPTPAAEPTATTPTNQSVTNTADNANESATPAPVAEIETEPSCRSWPWWAWLGTTIGFLALVYAYHYYIRKKRSALWLIGSAILTGGTLWLYFGYRCGNEFTWVAWVVAIGAGIMTVLRPQTFQSNFGGDL